LEQEDESKQLSLESLGKKIEFYRSRLQEEVSSDRSTSNKAQLSKHYHDILMVAAKAKETIAVAKRELKEECAFFKTKMEKTLELLKMKLAEESKKRKLMEHNMERVRKELVYYQGAANEFNSNQLANFSFRGTEHHKQFLGSNEFDSFKLKEALGGMKESSGKKKLEHTPVVAKDRFAFENKENRSVSNFGYSGTNFYQPQQELKTVSKGAKSKEEEQDKEDYDLRIIERESMEISKRIQQLRSRDNNVLKERNVNSHHN
jgi:hypothetical protein